MNMKKISAFLIISVLIFSVFGSYVLAKSSSDLDTENSEITIFYANGDWRYEPIKIQVNQNNKYLQALNYLVSGEKLPQGFMNEFPEGFQIESVDFKGNVVDIYINHENILKIDEINYSIDVIKDILSYNIFKMNENINKINVVCDDNVYQTINKEDFFEIKIDSVKEKEIKDLLIKLEEKFKNMSQTEIIEFIKTEKSKAPVINAAVASTYIVVLDPGHGGTDPGAVGTHNGTQYYEKNINLAIALAARSHLLTHPGISVLMTRTTDVSVSLTNRYLLANNNNAKCFVSVHINSSTSSSPNGCTAIYPNNHHISLSKILADVTVDNVQHWTNLVKHRAAYIDNRNLAVLRNTTMPAIITENGFMSSPIDLPYLITSSGQTAIGGQIGYSTWYWLQYWGY